MLGNIEFSSVEEAMKYMHESNINIEYPTDKEVIKIINESPEMYCYNSYMKGRIKHINYIFHEYEKYKKIFKELENEFKISN